MLQRSNTEPLGFSYIFSSVNVPRITSVHHLPCLLGACTGIFSLRLPGVRFQLLNQMYEGKQNEVTLHCLTRKALSRSSMVY